ncbi:MAG: chitobiase/beta-hexosaminidase C-terminal domain-containing protein [Desulfococcaceae bacterium]|nr:chitobiase/beta-hexosaminidase C-terminal domain-containing protein [Desulfococcaceae bacterium]
MKHTIISIPMLLCLLLAACPCLLMAAAQRTVTGTSTCTPSVSITATPGTSVKAWAVEETLPPGLTPINISQTGVWNPQTGIIRWGTFTDTLSRTLTYGVQGGDGTYSLKGKESGDGQSADISGTTEIIVNCTPPKVANPVFSPADGTAVPVTVTLTCATAGAQIRYTTDGSIPLVTSSLYTAPLQLISRTLIRAKAFQTGMSESDTVSATYPAPPAEPLGEMIRTVTENSSCAPKISLLTMPDAVVKAWAAEESIPLGLTPSDISDSGIWNPENRTIRWGVFTDANSRTLHYTLSGSDGTYTLSATASFNGKSEIPTGDMQVITDCPMQKVADPVFDPPSGANIPLLLSIACATSGSEIHYTTDSTIPDAGDTLYTVPFQISSPATVKAIAIKTGMLSSNVTTAAYGESTGLPAEFSRSVSKDGTCSPQISLTMNPIGTVTAWAAEEILPQGLIPENITENGVWNAEKRSIRWGVFPDGSSRTLSYDVSGAEGEYDISGTASADGQAISIDGDAGFTVNCAASKVAMPYFTPVSGTQAPGSVSIFCDTAGAEIRYTTDGSEPTPASSIYTGSIAVSASLTLKAKGFKTGLTQSDTASAYYPVRESKAIILAGGGPYAQNFLWDATLTCANYAYRGLLYQGYSKENIYYLNPVTEMDVDGDGLLNDVDAYASPTAFSTALTSWAKDASDLLIYMSDHGGQGTFRVNPDEILRAADMNTWLSSMQQTMPGRIIIIYDACQSGTFVPVITGNKRIIITSASDEYAYFLHKGFNSFSFHFWSLIYNGSPLDDAFFFGRDMMAQFQTALIESNGNGTGNEKEDKVLADNIIIGRGAMSASSPPLIRRVSPDQVLNGETGADISAGDILSLNPIIRVWAVIIPPGSHAPSPGDPVLELPEIELQGPDNAGNYHGSYGEFTLNGTYHVNIYAKDSKGTFSLPGLTRIIQTNGQGFAKGDINGDMNLNLADAILALKVTVGADSSGMIVPDYPNSGADANGDSRIGMEDAVYILRKVAGL